MPYKVNIVGAGLAGCEVALTLADFGVQVTLYEMKPHKFSSAHKMKGYAELVCSNSLRSNDPENAAGLLKEEMAFLESAMMSAANGTSVPAGKALAVDRSKFSIALTEKIHSHENIKVISKEVQTLDVLLDELNNKDSFLVIATGPLTSEALSQDIKKLIGSEYLYFYDSIAPIIDSESIDFTKGFKASRYGYGGDDYWNFPLSELEYFEFLNDLLSSEKVVLREFEDDQFFEGCLPVEIMASRGPNTLRYGPMKPFGLRDPKTGDEPYAVVQLRSEDKNYSMLNMVGFQTRLTWPEQKRIFRKIQGFENANFLRLGAMHRNTYINSPKLITNELELKDVKGLFFAGQITGVEGYIESAATGLWLGYYLASIIHGKQLKAPPKTTAIGSLLWHVANPNHRNFQPMNINFGLMPIIKEKIGKKYRKKAMVERAREDFCKWREDVIPQKANNNCLLCGVVASDLNNN